MRDDERQFDLGYNQAAFTICCFKLNYLYQIYKYHMLIVLYFAKLKRQHFKLLEEVVCNVGDKQPTTETNNSSFLPLKFC